MMLNKPISCLSYQRNDLLIYFHGQELCKDEMNHELLEGSTCCRIGESLTGVLTAIRERILLQDATERAVTAVRICHLYFIIP